MSFKSSFFRYLNAMVVSEIGAKLIDLGGVECRCRESVGGYVRSMRSLARWSMRDGEVGEYFNYVIIGEVRYVDPSGAVRDGLVCLSPCLCDAIRRLVSEEPELARYLAIAVTPLRKVYDLTRREDLLELRALAASICRAADHEAVLSRDVIADFAKHYIMRRAGEDWVDVDDVGEARERLRRYIPMLDKLIEPAMAGLINEVAEGVNAVLNRLGAALGGACS
jgi:hypothetical protein